MTGNGQHLDDDRLGAWMVAYDEALAGRNGPVPDAPPDSPELLAARECLDLLHVRWPRTRTAPAELPAPLTVPGPSSQIGRFRVLRTLGRGGNGVVFLAHDPVLGREVALKVPRPEALFDDEFRHRFLREARAAAGLRHPNVVAVHEAGEAGPVCYIAAAYCPGCNLAEWLRDRKEPVPLRAAAGLVAVVARAVHYTHGQGVVHRDLKPSNILFEVQEGDGAARGAASEHAVDLGTCRLVPQVTDFGLARLRESATRLTHTGAVLGTPRYMAPEQAEGRHGHVGPATDTYALGCILYELLTGQPPFCGASDADTVRLLLDSEAAPPSRNRRDVPRDLETVCLKCLEKEPQRRYPSAAALAEDLGRWLRGEPVRARRVGPLGRGWRWCRRKPGIACLVAALALAVLGGLTGVLCQWREAEAARREAEASEVQAQQLLNQLLQPSADAPLRTPFPQKLPDIDALLRAEAHFAGALRNRPGDLRVRVVLTNVRGSLGSLYALRDQITETDAAFRGARDLWEGLARRDPDNPEYRDWLATTCHWESEAARLQEDCERWIRLELRAYALWQELAEEQPGNPAPLRKMALRRFALLGLRDSGTGEERILGPLEEERAALDRLLGSDPTSTALRKRLALTNLVLGELHLGKHRARQALPYWRQAYEHYRLLARQLPDDALVALNLALCCWRLVADPTSDLDDTEAVARFEQAADRLGALAQQDPGSDWPQSALLEAYCSLAVCHWKAGRTALAEQTFRERVRPLVAQISEHGADHRRGWDWLDCLSRAAEWLQVDKPTAALALIREAAALNERCAESPSCDPASWEALAGRSVSLSAFLCRLGDPAEALRQAEQARRLCTGLRRAAPAVPRYGQAVTDAWERVAKARWALGRRDDAMAAFREAAAVQRQVVAQAPSVPFYRKSLSRCYDKLAYWGGKAGDRATAAAALLEREKLWPDDPEELLEVSRDFRKLADAVGNGQGPLSPAEEAERQRYLAESERTRRAAEALRRQASERANAN